MCETRANEFEVSDYVLLRPLRVEQKAELKEAAPHTLQITTLPFHTLQRRALTLLRTVYARMFPEALGASRPDVLVLFSNSPPSVPNMHALSAWRDQVA